MDRVYKHLLEFFYVTDQVISLQSYHNYIRKTKKQNHKNHTSMDIREGGRTTDINRESGDGDGG